MIAEDREYIDRVLSGEVSAFDGLVRKYNRMAGAIAYAVVGDFSSADDIVQDAFLAAYRNLGRLRDQGKFKVWLAGIVRSRAIDWLRRRKASRVASLPQVFPEDEGGAPAHGEPVAPGVEEQYARRELREKILEAIGSLPEEDRVVVTLKHMEGLSYMEIAELIPVPEDFTGYPETRRGSPIMDPAPFNHSTKIAVLGSTT